MRKATRDTVAIDNEKLAKASMFEYPGSRISADCKTSMEVECIANAAWRKRKQATGLMFGKSPVETEVNDLSHNSPTCMERNGCQPP
ncbi:hypothetical protein Y032_0009g767 [Ancylostoma ceylanicum]|uniref:Uncharacterized protein n=1 Tax=Ancylostoma ceylanicum TaxID=53326 RepID=A0A016VJQ0_9BILA|nr:hypothetical protein Y032_0009g767 [Ancylostoma ceylanicum]